MSEQMISRATLRLMAAHRDVGPDRRTTIADARAALALARGGSTADVDPATGYDISDAAYRTVRAQWRDLAAQGWSEDYDRPQYEAARELWARLRPDLTDNWLTGGAR